MFTKNYCESEDSYQRLDVELFQVNCQQARNKTVKLVSQNKDGQRFTNRLSSTIQNIIK